MKLVKLMCVFAGTLLAGQASARTTVVGRMAPAPHLIPLTPYGMPSPLRSGLEAGPSDLPASVRRALRDTAGARAAKAGTGITGSHAGSSPIH